jgi:hypothetical protein
MKLIAEIKRRNAIISKKAKKMLKIEQKPSLKPDKKDVSEGNITIEGKEGVLRAKWNSSKASLKKFSFWDKRKLSNQPEVSYFITMLFPNGCVKEWVITGRYTMFAFKGRNFVIDTNEAWYDLNQHQFRLYYHYEHCLPIRREPKCYVDAGNEAFFRIKSDNVKPVIKQEYVKVLASSNVDKYLLITIILQAFSTFMIMGLSAVVIFLAFNISKLSKAVIG